MLSFILFNICKNIKTSLHSKLILTKADMSISDYVCIVTSEFDQYRA